MALTKFCVPHAIPITMTESTYVVYNVSRRMLWKRTIEKQTIIPNGVIRLFESTIITSATIVGMIMSALTNDREYDSPEWVSIYTQAMICPAPKAISSASTVAGQFGEAKP